MRIHRTERDAFQSYHHQLRRNPPLAPRHSTMPGRFKETLPERLQRARRLLRSLITGF